MSKKEDPIAFVHTSADDLKSTLSFINDIPRLEMALSAVEADGQKTKARYIRTRIRALKANNLSAAPGGSSDTKSLKEIAPGKSPSKALALEIVVEPAPLLAKKSVNQVNTFSKPEDIETAICEALADEEAFRRKSAVADLRAGVLFFLYKESLGVAGRKYTGFWKVCQTKFGVTGATVSKKMRLALKWAKDCGADPAALTALAQAADLGDPSNPAVTLALDWIGEDTTSDLYRKHKLVNVGPTGGDRNSGKTLDRRSKEQIARDEYESGATAQCTIVQTQISKLLAISGPKGEAPVWILDDQALEKLKLSALDLHQMCIAAQARRKRN